MVGKETAKDRAARARWMGAAFFGVAVLTMPGGLWAQSALEQLKNESEAAGVAGVPSAKVEPTPAEAPAAQSPAAASADGKYHLTADQFAGIRRLVERVNLTQYKDISHDGREFSIRTSNGSNTMIFMYRTIKPGLLAKPRTYVFTLWMDASGGEVDPAVTIIGDWDVDTVDEASSNPSVLAGLRRRMLQREQGSGPQDHEASLSDPAMMKLLQDEIHVWANVFPQAVGSQQTCR